MVRALEARLQFASLTVPIRGWKTVLELAGQSGGGPCQRSTGLPPQEESAHERESGHIEHVAG